MTRPNPIAAAVRRQQGASRPIVVRVVGEGAYSAAAVFAAARGVVTAVDFPSLPTSPDGVLWLHDAPGSRSTADLFAAMCTLREWPWVLVLTGRAIDGAHPLQGETVTVQTPLEGGGAAPTAIRLEVPGDLPGSIARLAGEGDVARAHALYEHLWDREPDRAAPLCWIELVRLVQGGRASEVDDAGPRLWGAHRCRAQVLLCMAEAWVDLANHERTRLYLEALEQIPHTRAQAADAVFLRKVLDRDPEGLAGSPAGTTRLEVVRRHVLRVLGNPVDGPPLPGAFAEVYRGQQRSVEACLRVGDLVQAVLRIREGGAGLGGVYLHTGEVDDAVNAARRAVRSGDIASAVGLLGAFEERSRSMPARLAFLWLILGARCATERAEVGRLLSYASRLRAMGTSMWASAPLVADLVRGLDGSGDTWSTVSFLRLLEDCSRDADALLEPATAAQPRRPIVLGPYALDEVLASGGMGTVWRGRHQLTGRAVAVKVLDETTPTAVRLFRAEIDVVARFDHPMIVSVLDLLEVDARVERQSGGAVRKGQPALVMELVEHGTLADHLGQLAWPDIQAALVGVLEALAYAHAHGVVHRDLKPQNLLVGEGNALRLADFGLAQLDEGKVAGTPQYMAPEQFGRGPIGPAADLYAVGCIAWALIHGLPPFIGSVQQLAHAHRLAPIPSIEPLMDVPDGFSAWLERCLQKSPSARFPSAAEAAEALLAFDAPGLPPRAPTAPGTSGASTFVLKTLLDLPDEGGEPIAGDTVARRLHDIFEDRASWRPRIPTEHMLHKGDPPILFQREAQEALWTTFTSALAGRTQWVSVPGRGSRTVLRWLRRRARVSGLAVSEELVPGEVCIVDATGVEPDTLPERTDQRWMVIWRGPAREGTRCIPLCPLSPGAIWWILYSRIVLHWRTACQVAAQSVGAPSVAFALVEDWLEDPGVEMTTQGLQRLGAPSRPGPRTTAVWREAVARSTPARLHLAQMLAVQPDAVDGGVLREVVGSDADLRLGSMAMAANDAWRMPDDLRSVVLETVPDEERRRLHERFARHTVHPVARALHAGLAEPSRENTLALTALLRDVPAPTPVLQIAQRLVSSQLLEAPETRLRWQLRQMALEGLRGRAVDPDPRVADLARLELFERVGHWPEGLVALAEQDLVRPRRSPTAVRLGLALARELCVRGRREDALAMWDRLSTHLGERPDHQPQHLEWGRARCRVGRAAVQGYLAVLQGADPGIAPALHVDLSTELLRLGDVTASLHHVEQSRGSWSLAADYNRATALLALERDQEAGALTRRVTPLAVGDGGMAYVGFCHAELFLNLDEPTPMWETLADLVAPLRDPVLREVLGRRLDGLPSTTRTERLRRALGELS